MIEAVTVDYIDTGKNLINAVNGLKGMFKDGVFFIGEDNMLFWIEGDTMEISKCRQLDGPTLYMTAFPSDNGTDQDFIVIYLNGVIERFNTVTGDVVWKIRSLDWIYGPSSIFSVIVEMTVSDDSIVLYYYKFINRDSDVRRYVYLDPATGNITKMSDGAPAVQNFNDNILDYDQTTETFLVGSVPMKWVDFNCNVVKVEDFVAEFGFKPPTRIQDLIAGTEGYRPQASHRLVGYDRITKYAVWYNDREDVSCISQANGSCMVKLQGTSVISDFSDYSAATSLRFSPKYMWWIKFNRFDKVTGNHIPEIKRCDWPCDDCDTKPASSQF